MQEAIFLSASVPDPGRAPDFAKTADTIAITSAVSALVHVVLGRRALVWGGHPAITPMIWVVADEIGVDYGHWVKLYQSKYFEDEYPDDNARFKNVTYTEFIEGDREKSLTAVRVRMFKEHDFAGAVFIGGMAGVVDEFDLFRSLQPQAKLLPIPTTGGAALMLQGRITGLPEDLRESLDYVTLFHRHLHISTKELRYPLPADQPKDVERRLWRDKNEK